MVFALIFSPIDEILPGLWQIIIQPDLLITDYIVVGGIGAAFFNALSRALYDLKRFCNEYTEKDFSVFDDVLLLYFKRCGPYLTPVTDKKNYRSFVLHCLDCALLVSE